MSTPYAFSPDEFLPIHPAHLQALQTDMESPLALLRLVMGYAEHINEDGIAEAIDAACAKLEAINGNLSTEAVRQRRAALEEVPHAQ